MSAQKDQSAVTKEPQEDKSPDKNVAVMETPDEDAKKDISANGSTDEDLHSGLEKHDYKTLSNTPSKRPFVEPRTVIKPYEYTAPRGII